MQPIAGYTDQPDMNVTIVNFNKEVEESVLRMLDQAAGGFGGQMFLDPRWLAIARTHIEQGFMAFNRAVFQPQRVQITTGITVPPDASPASLTETPAPPSA